MKKKFKAIQVKKTGEWVRIVYDNDYDMWVAKASPDIPPTLISKRANLYLEKADLCLCGDYGVGELELVTVELVVK